VQKARFVINSGNSHDFESKTQLLVAFRAVAALMTAAMACLLISRTATATPQFGAATGQPCAACHVRPDGGPDLTHMGRAFRRMATNCRNPELGARRVEEPKEVMMNDSNIKGSMTAGSCRRWFLGISALTLCALAPAPPLQQRNCASLGYGNGCCRDRHGRPRLPAAIVAREAGASSSWSRPEKHAGGHAMVSGGTIPLGGGPARKKVRDRGFTRSVIPGSHRLVGGRAERLPDFATTTAKSCAHLR